MLFRLRLTAHLSLVIFLLGLPTSVLSGPTTNINSSQINFVPEIEKNVLILTNIQTLSKEILLRRISVKLIIAFDWLLGFTTNQILNFSSLLSHTRLGDLVSFDT